MSDTQTPMVIEQLSCKGERLLSEGDIEAANIMADAKLTIESLQQENKQLQANKTINDCLADANKILADKLEEVIKSNQRLTGALEFYADKENYVKFVNKLGYPASRWTRNVIEDNGAIATKALEGGSDG